MSDSLVLRVGVCHTCSTPLLAGAVSYSPHRSRVLGRVGR